MSGASRVILKRELTQAEINKRHDYVNEWSRCLR